MLIRISQDQSALVNGCRFDVTVAIALGTLEFALKSLRFQKEFRPFVCKIIHC